MQAKYYVESDLEGDQIGQSIAIEQSAGKSRNWDGISKSSQRSGSAHVTSVVEVEPLPHPLPVYTDPVAHGAVRRAYEIQVRYNNWIPQCGIGNLLNVVLGEPQHLATVRALRLKEIRLDAAEISSFGGPRYGRNVLTQGHDLVVAPIKPSAGLSPEEASALAFEAAMGGVDIVKDDELAFPGLRGAPEERYRQVASAVRRAEQETGTRRAYWANVITSPAKALKAAEMAVNAGADALLLAPALQGLDVCADVSASIGLPVVAHNVGVTSMTRVDGFGIDLSVWMYLQRLAGADAVLAPSPFGSFGISPQSARDAIRATNDEVPGVSATLFSHSGGVGPENVRRLKSLAPEIAVAFTAGSAIFDHPFGPRSGAEALVLAVRALGSQGPSA